MPRLDSASLADVVALAIKQATAPLVARMTALEGRAVLVPRDGAPGRDGRDADQVMSASLMAEIKALQAEILTLKSTPLPVLQSWPEIKTLDSTDVVALIEQHVKPLMEAIPPARDGLNGANGLDGKSVTVADVRPLIEAEVQKAAALIPPGKDGEPGVSVDRADVDAMIARHVAALPAPKDGASVTLDDVRPVIEAEIRKAVSLIPPSKDGAPGADGASIDPADVAALIAKHVAALPAPKDVTVEDVAPLITAEVQKAVTALPRAKDGQDGSSVTVADVTPLIASEVTKQIAAIPPPLDVPPEALLATFSGLLRKALPPIAAGPPLLLQKRVIRDRHGKVERVVEEVV